jgi:hypothetical protein
MQFVQYKYFALFSATTIRRPWDSVTLCDTVEKYFHARRHRHKLWGTQSEWVREVVSVCEIFLPRISVWSECHCFVWESVASVKQVAVRLP